MELCFFASLVYRRATQTIFLTSYLTGGIWMLQPLSASEVVGKYVQLIDILEIIDTEIIEISTEIIGTVTGK